LLNVLHANNSRTHTAGLCESGVLKNELPVSKPMTRLNSNSSLVQPTARPFITNTFCSSADNLHDSEAANCETSRLYDACTTQRKAAAQTKIITLTNHPQNHRHLLHVYYLAGSQCDVTSSDMHSLVWIKYAAQAVIHSGKSPRTEQVASHHSFLAFRHANGEALQAVSCL